MKKHIVVWMVLSLTALLSCQTPAESSVISSSVSSTPNSSLAGPTQYINDNKFVRGFEVYPADRSFKDGSSPDDRWSLSSRLYYGGNEKQNFAWTVRQAGDAYGLGDVYNPTTTNVPEYKDGFYIFKDHSKSLSVNPAEGAIRYELNTSLEYETARTSMEPWCHLLLEEGLSSRIDVSAISELTLSLDCTLDKLENHMSKADYNPNLHTCQFLIYFVCNTAASLDAGDYLWFGVPLYDYRYTVISEYGNVDAGTSGNTGKFIYSMSTESYLPSGITVGEENHISVNMRSALAHGLEVARGKGKLLNTTVNDLSIEYMNMGYEIPGTFDSAMTIANLSLTSSAH